MTKTRLYIARHGKTMFNTIGRAQGWSDTPLTEAGERGIQNGDLVSRKLGFLLKRLFPVILVEPFKPWGLFFKNLV